DLIEAIEAGKFHIYPVRTIEEGTEILTGVPAGDRDEKGAFPEDSVYGRAEARLRDMAKGIKEMQAKGRTEEPSKDDGEGEDDNDAKDEEAKEDA
ncbi:MAG: ATP-dependent protease, partial [Vicinamibacteria bacterium]